MQEVGCEVVFEQVLVAE